MSAQEGVNKAVEAFAAAKQRFDDAAESLLSDAENEPIKYKHVADFIETCQYYSLGNLAWR